MKRKQIHCTRTEDCRTYNHTDTMSRKRPVSPLFLSIAFLISSMSAMASSLQHNSTRPPGTPHPRFSRSGEDYDNLYDETVSTEPTPKSAGSPSPVCKYDICKDQQESCQKLELTQSCSCLGISGPFDPPDPPTLQSLSLESNRTGVVVRWCAPTSTVTHYFVRVEGQDEAHRVSEDRRMMELGDLPPGTEVCVEAVNKVAVSIRGKNSCSRFEPNSSEMKLAVRLVLIGTALLSVLAILVGVPLLWWCKRHRKTLTRTENSRNDIVL